MGTTYAEITLTNLTDITHARAGLIKPEDIRSVTVQAIVDTGAMSLVINEELCQKLGLTIKRERPVLVANGERIICKETESVEIKWKDRDTVLWTTVIPGAKKVLLGAIPLESMDLMVNPVTQELVGAHGDVMETMVLLAG